MDISIVSPVIFIRGIPLLTLFFEERVIVITSDIQLKPWSHPDANGNFSKFIVKTVACEPLSEDYHEADIYTVHQAMVSFATEQPSED